MKKEIQSLLFPEIAKKIMSFLFFEKKPMSASIVLEKSIGSLSTKEFKRLNRMIKNAGEQQNRGNKGTFFPTTTGYATSANQGSRQR